MIMILLFILLLSAFLGFEVISKVPATLHTPLMSGSNAISGITIVAAISSTEMSQGTPVVTIILAIAAVAFASINVVGGFMVTDRMLAMFKKR